MLKRSLANMANLARRDIIQLTALVKTRLRRMQYRPGLLTGLLTGTRLTQGKELRTIDGREYALEYPIHGDVALIKAHRADTMGNLVYRKTARNFGPVMAVAAAMMIAQVELVVAAGQLDPEAVVTPGIFVDRIVACPPAQALSLEAATR